MPGLTANAISDVVEVVAVDKAGEAVVVVVVETTLA